jgi:hypothetical protein
MTTVQVLREAARLVAKGWCRGASARNANERNVQPDNPTAVSFCASGALSKASYLYEGYQWPLFYSASVAVENVLGLSATESLYEWNDRRGRTQAEVVAALRKTARLEAKRLKTAA